VSRSNGGLREADNELSGEAERSFGEECSLGELAGRRSGGERGLLEEEEENRQQWSSMSSPSPGRRPYHLFIHD
jgi:hypothetical protein